MQELIRQVLIRQVQEACAKVCEADYRVLEARRAHADSMFIGGANHVYFNEVMTRTSACAAAIRALDLSHLSGWQPIETAPKDGTRILVSREELVEPVTIAYWSMAECRFVTPLVFSDSILTHWMPLPTAPVGEKKV